MSNSIWKELVISETKTILNAYPPEHPSFGNADNFECCGGNDAGPRDHAMDCLYCAVRCIKALLELVTDE